ncbi:MAG: hypothetical protein ACPL7J_07520, partial [Desulfomonilaceae bacterium]
EERVEQLADALERTQQRVEELAEAQKRTEQRIEELAEAQKRTEQRVEELAAAQKRTEERVEQLADALERTQHRVEELAEAQMRTEKAVRALAEAQRKTDERLKDLQAQVGTISHRLGYRLEDEAMWALPPLLARDHGILVEGELRRDFLSLPHKKPVEINILGEGTRQGREVMIMGEAKSQLKKRDVDQFLSLVKTVGATRRGEMAPILITYQTSPSVKEYAVEKGVMLYFSYQLRPPSYDRGGR